MRIIGCKLGCFTLIVCMMMNPPGTFFVDSIILDISHGLIELFIPMIKLNKYVIEPFFFPTLVKFK